MMRKAALQRVGLESDEQTGLAVGDELVCSKSYTSVFPAAIAASSISGQKPGG